MNEFDYKKEYQKALGVIQEQTRRIVHLRRELAELKDWQNRMVTLILEGTAKKDLPVTPDENHTVGMSAVEERG